MNRRRISKLGIKFMGSTLIPALLVLILAGIVCYNVVSQNKVGSIKQEVLQQASNRNEDVEKSIEELYHDTGMENGYWKIFNYITNTDSVQRLYYYTKAKEVLNDLSQYDTNIIRASWIVSFSEGLFMTDDNNKTREIGITDFNKFSWYNTKALKEDTVYYSDIYTSHIGSNNRVNKVISLVRPVFDKQTNVLIGAYGIDVSMLYIDSILKLNNDYEDSLEFVFDNNNNFLFYSGARTDDDYEEIIKFFENNSIKNNSYKNFKDNSYLSILTSMSNMDWNVGYFISKECINRGVNSIAMPMLITFFIAAITLTIVMILFVSKFIVRVKLIIDNTIDIANGEYGNRMAVDSDDEFGELAVAFNDTIDRLKYLAEHDDITNVYNVSTFYNIADELIKNNDFTSKYAIVRLDIDHFRIINDIYNWQVGNNVLLHIADSISKNLPEESVCGRLSGDVFVMCIKYKNITDLEKVLKAIKDEIQSFNIIVNVNPHFGVYLDAEKDIPIYLLCDRAGIALSLIKGNLLSTVSYYDNAINRKNMDIKFIETHMQTAIEEKQFYIQLQPKYDMETNQIVGAESLVRWKHPEKGIIKPELFIPIFEKNGFVIKLDEFVWEETCKLLKKWKNMGLKNVPISVNVSRVHIYDKNFVQNLCDLLERYDVPVELLELEFTESALLDDVKELYRLMKQLKQKNFALLMDDFASGYSSLNTLKSAPFDIVKIDKEFISAICESERDRMLVVSTISLINSQNMKIVVEGVERLGQVEILKEAGCHIAQGYYYSKPVDIDVFEKLVFGINN